MGVVVRVGEWWCYYVVGQQCLGGGSGVLVLIAAAEPAGRLDECGGDWSAIGSIVEQASAGLSPTRRELVM